VAQASIQTPDSDVLGTQNRKLIVVLAEGVLVVEEPSDPIRRVRAGLGVERVGDLREGVFSLEDSGVPFGELILPFFFLFGILVIFLT